MVMPLGTPGFDVTRTAQLSLLQWDAGGMVFKHAAFKPGAGLDPGLSTAQQL